MPAFRQTFGIRAPGVPGLESADLLLSEWGSVCHDEGMIIKQRACDGNGHSAHEARRKVSRKELGI
jgi:hypothetical protein